MNTNPRDHQVGDRAGWFSGALLGSLYIIEAGVAGAGETGGKMVRRFFIVIAVVLVLMIFCPAFAGQDITGWGKAKWGMTCAEVQKIYPGEWYPRSPPRWIAKEPFDIQGKRFFVMFYFPGKSPTSKLNKVRILSNGEPEEFSGLLGLLTQKYGRHNDYKPATSRHGKIWSWFRQSGQIALTVDKYNGKGWCEIIYVAAPKGGDKL